VQRIHRIEVGSWDLISTNDNIKNAIINDLNIPNIKKVKVINVYTIVGDLNQED